MVLQQILCKRLYCNKKPEKSERFAQYISQFFQAKKKPAKAGFFL